MPTSPSIETDKAAIPAEELDRVLALHESGHTIQAHELAITFGPLAGWTNTAARVVAGRLAMNLGAPRMAVAHHLRAYREAPDDAWARRELALNLDDQGRDDEAIAEMATATLLEPQSSVEASVRAHAGRRSEAMEAIRRSIDNDFAISGLIDLCDSLLERRDAVAFLEAELFRQVTFGDGLSAFARHARVILERATGRSPLDPINQGYLADALWKLGEEGEAVERITRSVRLDPSYEWAWQSLIRWSADRGFADLPLEIARDLAANRAGETRSWVRLARILAGPETLDPRLAEAIDLKAELLAKAGYREALELAPAYESVSMNLFDMHREDATSRYHATILALDDAIDGQAEVTSKSEFDPDDFPCVIKTYRRVVLVGRRKTK